MARKENPADEVKLSDRQLDMVAKLATKAIIAELAGDTTEQKANERRAHMVIKTEAIKPKRK